MKKDYVIISLGYVVLVLLICVIIPINARWGAEYLELELITLTVQEFKQLIKYIDNP